MYMFVEPHLPNDHVSLYMYNNITTMENKQAQKCTYMIICTVPNITLHTITVLPLTIVYCVSEVHCTCYTVLHHIQFTHYYDYSTK